MVERQMKDSGIAWAKQIPIHWKVLHNKYIMSKVKSICSVYKGEDILSLTINGVIVRDLDGGGKMPSSFDGYQYVQQGNLLMCLFDIDVTPRCVGIVKQNGITSPAYSQFKMKRLACANYYYYYYLMLDYTKELLHLAKNLRHSLTEEQLGAIKQVVPSLDEQKYIADFLDKECEKIDELKADIQAQIDLLEQYKRSVITEAVTHGFNLNTTMKDSGIDWVGKIPTDWQVVPLYCLYDERKSINSLGKENNLLSLSYGKVIQKDINISEGLLPSNYNGYNIVESDDIIIRPTDLQNDKRSLRTGLVKKRGIITSAYIALKPKSDINSKYYHYLLHSYDIKKVFYNMGNGVRQGLNYDEFSKLMVLVPSKAMQQKIADYLDHKCAEIEQTINGKKAQLDTLDDYKKSLIYEYVTGKKEAV